MSRAMHENEDCMDKKGASGCGVIRARELLDKRTPSQYSQSQRQSEPIQRQRWSLSELAGRITEIYGSAALSAVALLIEEAQAAGEDICWVQAGNSLFYPPDMQLRGIDLSRIVIVDAREPNLLPHPLSGGEESREGVFRQPPIHWSARLAGRVAATLLHSNSFPLVVLDLGAARLETAAIGKLLRLADAYATAVVCITEGEYGLGSLVGLRVEARFSCGSAASDAGQWQLTIIAVKDKQNGPFWSVVEACHDPSGLR